MVNQNSSVACATPPDKEAVNAREFLNPIIETKHEETAENASFSQQASNEAPQKH